MAGRFWKGWLLLPRMILVTNTDIDTQVALTFPQVYTSPISYTIMESNDPLVIHATPTVI
jgi:hypothetical protein